MRHGTAGQSDSHAPLGANLLILPSRRALLDRAQRELLARSGPILLSGEPGIGKSWLAQRLAVESETHRTRWLTLDLAPGLDPEGLLLALAHRLALGIPEPWTAPLLRVAIADALDDLTQRGRRIALILDEAHLASPAVLEELRVWSNRLDRSDGLDALLLLGQTPLLRSLRTGQAQALQARIAWSAALRPIDADEALLLAQALKPARTLKLHEVEAWHAASLGNPARFLRIAAQALKQRPHHGRRRLRGDLPHPAAPPLPPPLLPTKPPLLTEDGLIEVGYAGDDDPPLPTSTPTAEAAPPIESHPDHPPPRPLEPAPPLIPQTPASTQPPKPGRAAVPRGPLRPEPQHDRAHTSTPHFARRSDAE